MEIDAGMSADSAPKARRKRADSSPADRRRHGRSAVTNGSVLLRDADGRSAWVRRAKDIISEALSDLGGVDNTSAAERSIVRRAATLTVELERLEARFATAGEASADDLDLYQRTAGNLRRLLEAVGLQRRARNVTPSLSEYLAKLQETEEAEANKPATEEGAPLASGRGAAHG